MSSPLDDRLDLLVAASARSRQGISWAMLRLGALAWLAGFLLTPPWAYIGLVLAGGGILIARLPIHRFPGFWIGVAYSIWMLGSVAAAQLAGRDGGVGGQSWTWLVVPCVALAGRDFRIRRAAVIALGVLVPLLLLFGIAQGFRTTTGHWVAEPLRWEFGLAFRGFMPHRLSFGFTMAMATLILCTGIASAGISGWWLWLARGAAIVATVLSGARSAILGLAAGTAALGLRYGRRGVLISSAVALLVLGGAGAYLMITSPKRIERLLAFEDGRLPIWRQAIAVTGEHPLLGIGGRHAWKAEYKQRRGTAAESGVVLPAAGEADAHNTWLALCAEHGLPAAILLSAFLATLVWSRRHEGRTALTATLATAACVVVASQFENYLGHTIPSVAAFAALGATFWTPTVTPAATTAA